MIEELKKSGINACIKLKETLSNWKKISNIQKYNVNKGLVEGKITR